MTASPLAIYLDRLDRSARDANAKEDTLRRDLTRRLRELEDERAFAFRRLNLMRSVSASIAEAKDGAEAVQKGSSVLLREVGWTGANEQQKQVVERFIPVVISAWNAAREEGGDPHGDAVGRALAEFENWFAEDRKTPFLALLGREVVELPLVEVS